MNQISQLGLNHAATLPDPSPSLSPKTDAHSLAPINWYGEVVDLLLDGRVTLRFPSGARESFPLDRIYLLDDGMGPGMEEVDGEASSQGSWETDEEGGAEGMPGGGVSWEEREADEQGDEVMSESEGAGWAEDHEEENGLEVKEIVLDEEVVEEKKEEGAAGEEKEKKGVSMPAEVEDDENWKRFLMLEEAPSVRFLSPLSVARLTISPLTGPPLRLPTPDRPLQSLHVPRPKRAPRPLLLPTTKHPGPRLREPSRPPSLPHHRSSRHPLRQRAFPL